MVRSVGYSIPFTGLGDTIYIRPYMKELAKKHTILRVRTPWPEFFSDVPNIEFIHPGQDYRTQMKNVRRHKGIRWANINKIEPTVIERTAVKFGYGLRELEKFGSIAEALEQFQKMPAGKIDLSLPSYPAATVSLKTKLSAAGWNGEPICIIRPVTTRSEWPNTSRSAKQEYIRDAATIAKERGFYTVQVADADGTAEWMEEPIAWCDANFTQGELVPTELIELCRLSECMVTTVGWAFVASLATKVPTLVIYGGQGGINNPNVIVGPRFDDSNMVHMIPDKHCMCKEMNHKCDKYISNHEQKIKDFLVNE